MEEIQNLGAQRAQQLWVLSMSEMLILITKLMSAHRMPGSGVPAWISLCSQEYGSPCPSRAHSGQSGHVGDNKQLAIE